MHGHGQHFFGRVLADDIIVELGFQILGGNELTAFNHLFDMLVADDVVAHAHAFVADIHPAGAGDEVFNLVLAFFAKRTTQHFIIIVIIFHSVAHGLSLKNNCRRGRLVFNLRLKLLARSHNLVHQAQILGFGGA